MPFFCPAAAGTKAATGCCGRRAGAPGPAQVTGLAVGDMVEANVGTFKSGKILKQWDEGNAYRIEIQDEKGTNVWAPVDVDAYVRAAA